MNHEWAAGLFEGEGTIRKFNPAKYFYEVAIKMTDLDILVRMQNLYGGTINLQPLTAPHHKPIWRWSLGTKSRVRQFLINILPHLGYRRAYAAQNLIDRIDGAF